MADKVGGRPKKISGGQLSVQLSIETSFRLEKERYKYGLSRAEFARALLTNWIEGVFDRGGRREGPEYPTERADFYQLLGQRLVLSAGRFFEQLALSGLRGDKWKQDTLDAEQALLFAMELRPIKVSRQLSVRLPATLRDELDSEAEKQKITLSRLVKNVIEEWLDKPIITTEDQEKAVSDFGEQTLAYLIRAHSILVFNAIQGVKPEEPLRASNYGRSTNSPEVPAKSTPIR